MGWLLASMGVSFLIGIAAVVTAIREQDAYFNEKPCWERISAYRIPEPMMIGCGISFVPVLGVVYAFALWAVYFSGKRFG